MIIPVCLRPFVSAKAWRKLALHQLEADDRKSVLEALNAGFERIDPKKIDPRDVAGVLDIAQRYADDLREPLDHSGFKNPVVLAADHIAREVIRAMKKEKRAQRKVKNVKTKPKIVYETYEERRRSEGAYRAFICREAKVRQIKYPKAADALPNEDRESDNE